MMLSTAQPLLTSPQLYDVWTHEIGPRLEARDITTLALVNWWAYAIAHHTTSHCGLVVVRRNHVRVCEAVARVWPNLNMKVVLSEEDFDEIANCNTNNNNNSNINNSTTSNSNDGNNNHATTNNNNSTDNTTKSSNNSENIIINNNNSSRRVIFNEAIANSIKSLCLCGRCEVSDYHVIGLHNTRGLREFYLIEPRIKLTESSPTRTSLTQMLMACQSLLALELSDCRSPNNAADVTWVAEILSNLPHLTHLDLEHNFLTANHIEQIKQPLGNLRHLTFLNLSSNRFDADGVNILVHGNCLSKLVQLKTLDLSANQFGENGMHHLANVLSVCTQLTHLDLCGNAIGESGSRHLAQALANLHHVTTLIIFGNQLGSVGLNVLLPVLSNLPHLTTLHIQANDLEDSDKAALCRSLLHLTNLGL